MEKNVDKPRKPSEMKKMVAFFGFLFFHTTVMGKIDHCFLWKNNDLSQKAKKLFPYGLKKYP